MSPDMIIILVLLAFIVGFVLGVVVARPKFIR